MSIPTKVNLPSYFFQATKPARYKGIYGGRGSGKSHCFGGYGILECLRRTVRMVCIREVQNTIGDSVKRLLEDKIVEYGVQDHFDITEREIRGPNDSLIIFRGMQNHTAQSIKSLEGFNVAWFEEAQTASQKSLDLLIPTIREEGSELWFSWNPDQPSDPVDKLLRGPAPPQDAIVIRANYSDNPWFPEALRADMERDRQNDPERFAHIWLGEYQSQADQQFIGWDVVRQAQERIIQRGDKPVLFGLDVARFGDDRSVLCIREGDSLTDLMVWEKVDTQQLAGMVLEIAGSRKPDAVFVDGVGVGGGVVDRLRVLNLNVIEVNAGGKAGQETRYINKRAEMWGRMKEWLGGRGRIGPYHPDLGTELTGPFYSFDPSNRIKLEKKEDMKKRGLKSPDLADALALTFAQPIAAPHVANAAFEPHFVAPENNVLDSYW